MKSEPARRLLDLIEWLRARLETLKTLVDDDFVTRNLEALIRACDPQTNPRLRQTVEDLDLPASTEVGEPHAAGPLGGKASRPAGLEEARAHGLRQAR